jgi:hypothetical protein
MCYSPIVAIVAIVVIAALTMFNYRCCPEIVIKQEPTVAEVKEKPVRKPREPREPVKKVESQAKGADVPFCKIP